MPTRDLAYVDCPRCELHGTHAMPPPGAEQLAGRHDDLHHRGDPTAVLRHAQNSAPLQRAAS